MEIRSTIDQQKGIVITRDFDAPRELVWKTWTKPYLLAQWYGLSNSTLSDVEMDVRVGGRWSAVMHIPNVPDMPWKGEYLEVVEPERLVYAFRNPVNVEDPNREITTVTLEDLGGKTKMVFTQSGNLQPQQYKQAKQGWNAFFDRLETVLKKTRGEIKGANTGAQYKTIDEYIETFPEDIQVILQKIKRVIQETAPEATDSISYQMPAFKLNGNLVWFAAFKNHIGLYPIPSGVEALKEEMSPYIAGKGTLQFPLDKPIPYDLIKKIVASRVKENLGKKKIYSTRRSEQ